MSHFLAMQQKLAGDVEDSQLHHAEHGAYEDLGLPHRSQSRLCSNHVNDEDDEKVEER
jgi:hypothetical protein